jgi:halimadienyl-diphosphate synthase
MDYKNEARELVNNLRQRMGSSPYDIAWMARLRTPDGAPRWPDLIDWLLDNQHDDGSWGGEIVYYHERILCTLAALIALRQNGFTRHAQHSIKLAEQYIWRHLHLLSRDPFELVGFELLLPTLLLEALEAGLDVPTHTCGYGEIQTAKLRLIPPNLLYSPHVSTIHSLEFLGYAVDHSRLRQALGVNGSLGNSPAATAYYLLHHPAHEGALDYLENMRQQCGHVIYLYPFRIFELVWTLKNLMFSGMPLAEFTSPAVWADLQSNLGPTGIGLDATFGIADGDITSVTAQLLIAGGYEFDPQVLARFEDQKTHIFRTYDYERNPSVGTNVHALEALHLLPEYPNRREVQEQIVLMLLDKRVYELYWLDKWHTSPYYATTHAIVALLAEGHYLEHACQTSIDWLLHTQNDDGSWGYFQMGTVEETAYALTALLHYNRHHAVNQDVLHRGVDYLARQHDGPGPQYPELWIGKDLYVPYDVVRAAVLSALILYEDTFGRAAPICCTVTAKENRR